MTPETSRPSRVLAERVATLACRNGFLDEAGAREAMERWEQSGAKVVLGEFLEASGGLPLGAGHLLELLAALQGMSVAPVRPETDHQPSRTIADTVNPVPDTRHWDIATPPASPHSPDQSVGTVVTPSVLAQDVTTGGPDGFWTPSERYRAVHLHAQGGLGVIYVAIDSELNREVALKEIKSRHANDPRSRARFVREAEITAQLEHPGIVPIHGLGSYVDGRPYYAMRFIRGESLQEVIHRFHREQSSDSAARSMDLRGLLRRFLDVCDAVDYAHSRHVLHRDLKPVNVMVGQFGETLVVDWGLARVQGTAAEVPPGADRNDLPPGGPQPSPERGVQLSPAGNSSETTQGQTIGTVGYMSPEQAEGRLDELGPTSDVYSLGAILYKILTGRATIVPDQWEVVIRRITTGDFPAPRAVSSRVPRALEAICLKALAVSPSDRYPTTRALADDLERWLADEPVHALPDRLVDRVARWTRRHRQATVSALVTLLTVATVAVVAAVVVERARRRTNSALLAETLAKSEADRGFRKARQAVDDLLTAVSESRELSDLPNTQEFKRKLLEKARDYYREFIQSRGNDSSVRTETGAAILRLAQITAEIDSLENATQLNVQAVALLQPEVDRNPGDPQTVGVLAKSLDNLGRFHQRLGNLSEAERDFRDSLRLTQRARGLRPEDPTLAVEQVGTLANLGDLLAQTGRARDAEGLYLQAKGILQELIRDDPRQTDYAALLGEIQTSTGELHRREARIPEAEEAFRQAAESYRTLVRDQPAVSRFRLGLADALTNLGVLQRATRRLQDAERSYAQAAQNYDRLARDNPRVTVYRYSLAGAWTNQGNALRASGRRAEADAAYQRAIAALEHVVREEPAVSAYRLTLAGTLGNLGNLLMDLRRREECEAAHRRAVAILEDLVKRTPQHTDYRSSLASALQNLGGAIAAQGPSEEAVLLCRRAVALQHEALATNPRNPQYLRFLSSHLTALATILREQGRGTEAAEATRERASLWPGDPDIQYDLACEFALASRLAAGPESAKLANEAIDRLRAAIAAGWDDADQTAHEVDLTPLRTRPDFQVLLQTLQDRTLPDDPFAPLAR